MMVSHLYWSDFSRSDERVSRDSQRVLECLQKSLKIAHSVMNPTIFMGLCLELLEHYIWYFDKMIDKVYLKANQGTSRQY